MTQLLLALALGAGALSNFPREAGGKIAHPAIAVSLGGAPAVIVPAGDLLTGFRADGSTPSGLPVALGTDEVASGGAAAADMDGDGRPEVAVATASGKVFLWSGAVLPGFPVSLGARAKAGVSFGDVDGDGKPELLVGDDKGRVHALKRTGAETRGYPLAGGKVAVTSSVSASVFAAARTIAYGTEDGKVQVLDAATGRSRPGFPLATQFTVSGAPVFADLDDDGEMDLVASSQDFGVYAVNAKGEPLPGFPASAAYRIYEAPAVADLDGDHRLDVIFASADGFVHAVSAKGTPLRGWPVRAGARLFGAPAVGDLDRDGALDVAAVLADGNVQAFDQAGRPLPGFPAALGAEAAASPLLVDLAQDGALSIFVGLASGDLHAVRAAKAGTAAALAPWAAPGRDAARSGRYGPNPPVYKALELAPAAPRVTDGLIAKWRGFWLDAAPGEGVPAPRVEWLRGGQPVKELAGKAALPAGAARRGERWRFVLTSPAGATFDGPEVTVLDSAPGAPEVALEPAAPSRNAPVKALVSRPAPDADGDPLRYEIAWLQDGLETGVLGETFPGDRLRKGALLTARVIATDGELRGPAATAQARVGDTAPGALVARLEPALPKVTEPVRARVEQPAVDVDGDALRYHHRWTVDGAPVNLPLGAPELRAGLARKHQKVAVDVRAFDGQLEGPPSTAEVVILNTPPTAPKVVIVPQRPRKGDALRAVLATPAEDADRDPLTYRFAWRKNGSVLAVAGDGREVPGLEVARGDRFEVTVIASDGEADGPPASTLVAIGNTPPVPPRIAIEPAHPKGGEPLKLVILDPAKDADGDTVRLGVAWTHEGKPTGTGAEVLEARDFRKHERIRVVVTPRDGEEAGAPVAQEVVVDDAPPGAPAIAFATETPMVTAPLPVSVKTPAPDADGDPVRYRYRWLKDGVPVPMVDGTEASKAPPYWSAAPEVPKTQLAKGQRWTVEVQAFDGELYGPVVSAAVTVVNAPPPPPKLAFAPDRPRRVDGIALALTQPPDADGDVITYRYAWTRNGVRFDAPPDQAQIPRGLPKKGERWSVEVVASDGEAEAPATRLEVVVADTAPGPTSIALCDGPVPAGTLLQARVTLGSTDADGDPVAYRHEWTVNGKAIPAMSGQARLTAPALRKHDLVRVVVTPWDGELTGPAAAAECAVVNTPPAAPTVALEPSEPTARSGLQLAVRRPSADRDGDAVTYRFAWMRDGVPAAFEGATIPAGVLHHDELWQIEVTPYDGEEEGERVRAQAIVKNTGPSAPSVLLRPEAPVVGDALTCDVQAPQRDIDQEPIALFYRWYRDERPVALAEGNPHLPSGVVRRGERWRCESWASDGTDVSARATAEVTVRNSPPSAPQVVIEPEKARRADDLTCRIATPSVDADGDAVSYTYAWWRGERPMPPGADPARVEASRIRKGERWRCAATPSDGTLAGIAGGADRTISNTPPGPARVRVEPSEPRDGQALRCELSGKSEDADGDALRYRFAWFRNGAAQPFADTSQEVPARLVRSGDRWRCQVVPTDEDEDGPTAGSEEAEITGRAAQALAPSSEGRP
jgi:hypothetical protein